MPDEYFGTFLLLRSEDEAEVAWVLAHFVNKVEAIEEAVQQEVARSSGVLGRVELELHPDGSFTASWQDHEGHEKMSVCPEAPR